MHTDCIMYLSTCRWFDTRLRVAAVPRDAPGPVSPSVSWFDDSWECDMTRAHLSGPVIALVTALAVGPSVRQFHCRPALAELSQQLDARPVRSERARHSNATTNRHLTTTAINNGDCYCEIRMPSSVIPFVFAARYLSSFPVSSRQMTISNFQRTFSSNDRHTS